MIAALINQGKTKTSDMRRTWVAPLYIERFLHGAYHSTILTGRDNDRSMFFLVYLHQNVSMTYLS